MDSKIRITESQTQTSALRALADRRGANAERQYHKILAMPKPKKKLTYKQALARKSVGDKMQMIIQDMTGHIKREIALGSYSWSEFMNDPTVYFDSQVMGKYYNNYIIRQAVISYFKNEFIPF